MRESKRREKRRAQKSAGPIETSQPAGPTPSPRWLVPLMLALFLVGLLWIVLYYLLPGTPPFSTLGAWNMLVGFGLIMCGFMLSTRWR